MQADVSTYGAVELTSDEASATFGGSWLPLIAGLGIAGLVVGIMAIAGACVADVIIRHKRR